jgi:glutaredoxin
VRQKGAMALVLHDLCGRDPELRFSPYCWRAKLALAHKGLEVESVLIAYSDRSPVEQVSGQPLVPVIDAISRYTSWQTTKMKMDSTM